ncbi:MAG: NosD domain-containing protein [Promethearchaeota archaeon]
MKVKRKQLVYLFFFFTIFIFANVLNYAYIDKFERNLNKKTNRLIEDYKLKNAEITNKIHIDNNWSAAKAAGICTGDGNYSKPYVIEDLIIDGGGSGSCILIENSNVSFIIRNCTLYNSGSGAFNGGIRLDNVDNGQLINDTAKNNYAGIYLDHCNNNTILENTLNENENGIYADHFNNNTISGNTLNNPGAGIRLYYSDNTMISRNTINNSVYGIYLGDCYNNTVIGNLMNYCEIVVRGSYLLEVASHYIDDTNLVNNKPVYYYANEIGLGTNNFTNAGQIILINCSNSIISELNLSNDTAGIYLYYSHNNTLSGITVNNNNLTRAGIWLRFSDNNTLSGNTANNNENGIDLYFSNNNILSGNTANNNQGGIVLYASHNNTISGNTANYNDYGIPLAISNNNTLSGNTINNNGEGIYLDDSDNNTLSGNTINNNDEGIILEYSHKNTFFENIFRDNIEYGIFISDGIYEYSTQNLFFQNYFLSNIVHAYDGGIDNYWNNSIIGNYWDNYIGVDVDHDGIGDTPYYFYGGADYLPIYFIRIIINSPKNFDVFGAIAPNFNITINESKLDKMWYSLNGGANINFTEFTGKINQSLWDNLPEGNVVIKFYANDTIGRIGFQEVSIKKDITAPSITINNPHNNEIFSFTAPNFNITIDEPNLDKTWYSLMGSKNITFSKNTGIIDQALWDTFPEGDITIKFYANDTLGRIGFQEVSIKKESTAPIITINNPRSNEIFGVAAPSFNITIDESYLDKTWYSLNGDTNITFRGFTGKINQTLWDALPEGNVAIKFYANNTLGRIGFQEVIVIKEISPRGIPGYDLIFLVGFMSAIAVIIIRKKLNHLY